MRKTRGIERDIFKGCMWGPRIQRVLRTRSRQLGVLSSLFLTGVFPLAFFSLCGDSGFKRCLRFCFGEIPHFDPVVYIFISTPNPRFYFLF